jgi:alpha-tubulin suppressor-like RCC1 family protein
MPLGVQYSGMWTLAQQFQAVGAGTWKGIPQNSLYVWGTNAQGQIGDGTVVDKSSPIQVGALAIWSQISVGSTHTMALKTDGTLWTWGRGTTFGQLGDNAILNRSSPVQIGALTTWSKIATGGNHSLAIKTDGTMWLWGRNAYSTRGGMLGDNTVINRSSPVQVGALTTWSLIAAGTYHSIATKTDGTLWAWGNNGDGEQGDNSVIAKSSPVQVGALTTWSKISGGLRHTMALKTDGSLWAWGRAACGQLGDNTVVYRSSPVQIGSLTTWSQVAANSQQTLAIKTDGTLWSWGENQGGGFGKLGLNDTVYRSSPTQVGALTTWSQIDGGSEFCMAIKTDGTLWAWGTNSNGQLGDTTIIARSSPVQIGSITTWSLISAGGSRAAGIATVPT